MPLLCGPANSVGSLMNHSTVLVASWCTRESLQGEEDDASLTGGRSKRGTSGGVSSVDADDVVGGSHSFGHPDHPARTRTGRGEGGRGGGRRREGESEVI